MFGARLRYTDDRQDGDHGDAGDDDDVDEKHNHVPLKIVDDGDRQLDSSVAGRSHSI